MAATTQGSFLLASCLCVGGSGDPAPHITDSAGNVWSAVVSQSPVPPYNPAQNTLYMFYAINAGSGSVTFTLNVSNTPAAIRFWIGEYTGQAAGNPIAANSGTGFITVSANQTVNFLGEGTGAFPPIKRFTDLTAILTMWTNPPTSALSNFDSGLGSIRVGTAQGIFLADDVLSGSGFYIPNITAATIDSSGNGNVILVKSLASLPLASGDADVMATDETNIRSAAGSRMSTGSTVSARMD